jgi:hypothetical protein
MGKTVEVLFAKMQKSFEEFSKEVELGMKGNKSAAKRARKISLELAKDFKEYRQLSLNGAE